jgi:uncharacterized protein YgiM (DUF1202 family)
MLARHFAILIATGFALALPPALRAQDAVPDVENSKQAFAGAINASDVFVRSGPGDNYYPAMKLDRDAPVKVVGIKFDWLKIAPPDGSFSYVAKAFVDRQPNGTGIVNRDEVNVRAGSTLNPMKTSVQAKLSKGQTVTILNEEDEYYRITPPAGAYLYVNQQFVTPVRAISGAVASVTPRSIGAGSTASATETEGGVQAPTTAPSEAQASAAQPRVWSSIASATPASTQPSADAEFDKLETQFIEAGSKKIAEQPIDELLAGYQKILASGALPESMRRIADFRVTTLKSRQEAREQLLAVQKMQQEAEKRRQALKSEQEELQEQIKRNDVQLFTAVGTLRTSSYQQGPQMLYRLTDPATGRPVVYLRTSDPKNASMIGQFIGVKGDLTTESQLSMKVVTATDCTVIDPAQLFKSVAAQVIPPSMVPQPQQVSSGN